MRATRIRYTVVIEAHLRSNTTSTNLGASLLHNDTPRLKMYRFALHTLQGVPQPLLCMDTYRIRLRCSGDEALDREVPNQRDPFRAEQQNTRHMPVRRHHVISKQRMYDVHHFSHQDYLRVRLCVSFSQTMTHESAGGSCNSVTSPGWSG